MIGLTDRHRYFIYQEATDMRKGFHGFGGLVRNEMGKDPLSGDVFIFINKRKNQMKLLFWESGGYWLYYKRLEQGRFEVPTQADDNFSWQKLVFIIQGISLQSVQYRKRYIHKIG